MHDLPLISTIAAGFTAAWILGLFTQWLRLSPIVGYLLAGVAIGPHTPGFQGDIHLAHQLAEIGVILLMFGVGLHFHIGDLVAVKSIAVPGALGQSLAATLASIAVLGLLGFSVQSAAVVGIALAVASTVVLMRVLMDADALNSPPGHVAVGWLLVEDVLTVIVLVLIPIWGQDLGADATSPWLAVGVALGKLFVLVGVVFVLGRRFIPWSLTQVARLRSRELFTLTVMVFSIAMAAGSYALFGASMALGAFLAGMMVALSPVSHQAAADALPLRDAFAVLFFVSVGMLFDPAFLVREPLLMLAVLGIILVVKPLVALLIVAALGHPPRTALTVAIGLAQIGEFSFIVAELAKTHGLMPADGINLLVGGAIISITLNPLLFRSLDRIEAYCKRQPRLWSLLNARAERAMLRNNSTAAEQIAATTKLAIVVGYGPVGQTVNRLLRDAGVSTVVIDMNMDTVAMLRDSGQLAIFGDATRDAILESAGVSRATHLVLTLPQATDRVAIVAAARHHNVGLKIFVRARYLREREDLVQVGTTAAVFEEAEAAVALARQVLTDAGGTKESVERAVRDIRTRLILDNVSTLRRQSVRTIMLPWTRVRRLRSTASLDEVRRQVAEHRFSRWPVMTPDSATPSGYLLAKDLIGLPAGGDWATLVRPLKSLAPDADVETVLNEFQTDAATIGLVVDRGLPLGLVTIEDMLEQVIGRIEDEYPRHDKLKLSDVIVVNDALLALNGATAEEVIAELAAHAPAGMVPEEIARLAIEREREFSTHLGFGVAVPHARCPVLPQPFVVFGRSESGIAFDAANEPVKLVFLLATPVPQPQVQVLLLGQIAAIVSDPAKRQRLLEAASTTDIMAIIRE